MRSPRVGPWGPKVHGGGAARGAAVETVSGGVMDAVPPRGGGRGQAASVHIRSGGRDRQAKCATATARRCGRMAAECTCTAREFGSVRPPHRAARQDRARRARPRRRLRHLPVRPADERLADRNPRSRLAGLAGTVRRVG